MHRPCPCRYGPRCACGAVQRRGRGGLDEPSELAERGADRRLVRRDHGCGGAGDQPEPAEQQPDGFAAARDGQSDGAALPLPLRQRRTDGAASGGDGQPDGRFELLQLRHGPVPAAGPRLLARWAYGQEPDVVLHRRAAADRPGAEFRDGDGCRPELEAGRGDRRGRVAGGDGRRGRPDLCADAGASGGVEVRAVDAGGFGDADGRRSEDGLYPEGDGRGRERGDADLRDRGDVGSGRRRDGSRGAGGAVQRRGRGGLDEPGELAGRGRRSATGTA